MCKMFFRVIVTLISSRLGDCLNFERIMSYL